MNGKTQKPWCKRVWSNAVKTGTLKKSEEDWDGRLRDKLI